ncbi:hypothetical protein [Streptomyces sp. NPDC001135]
MARRPVPLPGDAEAPRGHVPAQGADRPERHTTPISTPPVTHSRNPAHEQPRVHEALRG